MFGSKELYLNYQNNKYYFKSFYEKLKQSILPFISKSETSEQGRLYAGQKMPTKKTKIQAKKKIPSIPTYDNIGSQVNLITNQMMVLPDGFDLSFTNIVADNGNFNVGIQGDKYFSMKHTFSFDGPLSFLMSGGQRDYSVECLVQSGANYTLMSNLTPGTGTLDGQWEYRYKNISFLFAFAVTNSNDPRLNLMLPNYFGKLTWANSRHNLTIGKSQTESWYLSTFHRLTSKFLIGSKFLISSETQETNLSLGGSYKIIGKSSEFEILECRINNKVLNAFYTKTLNKYSTLCTKFDLNFGQRNASSSIMYKYIFGNEANGIQILGEITSKLVCRTIFMIPFMQRFIFRINGEMNRFYCNPQRGQVPHKFGFQIQMQI